MTRHIKRVLHREAWESAIHARKFQRILDKLSPQQAKGAPGVESGLPEEFLNSLQKEVTEKYNEMLQHIRSSWVFQKNGMMAWQLMDHAMEKMKQIVHFAEGIAENGRTPEFKLGKIDSGRDIGSALKTMSEKVIKSQTRHLKLRKDSELNKHGGMVINLDLTIQQEQYEAEELKGMVRKK